MPRAKMGAVAVRSSVESGMVTASSVANTPTDAMRARARNFILKEEGKCYRWNYERFAAVRHKLFLTGGLVSFGNETRVIYLRVSPKS